MRNIGLFGNKPIATVCCGCAILCLVGQAAPASSQSPPGNQSDLERTRRVQQLREQAALIRKDLEALKQGPEGVTQSTAPRSEFTEQPTRHMRESLESLPGMSVRQGNGPRDFNISIRGSGASAGSR